MKNIIQSFIPDTVAKDADSQRRAQVAVATLLVIAYFNINYIGFSLMTDYVGGLYSQVPNLLLSVATLFLYKRRVSTSILYPIFFIGCTVCISITVFYSGGYQSILFPWLATTPIVAMLIWNRRGGMLSAAVVVAAVLVFYFLNQANYPFENQIQHSLQQYFYLACNVGLVLILFAIALVFDNATNAALANLNDALAKLAVEKARSDKLLLNILAYEIAEELKTHGQVQARLVDEVSVLFSDFKGFTGVAEQLSPQELVAELNVCFSAFDRIMQEHGIEKIKTIGDSYMAVGGLPTERPSHAHDVVTAAHAMQRFMLNRKLERSAQGLVSFDTRIGIHTGPVVAGVVGTNKFQYDIWGDTVNLASRMESSGEAGKVNVSEATYEKVKRDFALQPRGKVQAKGKGEVSMYFAQDK